MSFASPRFLVAFAAAIPLLGMFLIWSWHRRQLLIRQFVQSRLLAQLTVGISATRRKIRMALPAAAILSLLFALARPQWGRTIEETRATGLDVVILLDVSRSMLARDLSPSRLERAKIEIQNLLRRSQQNRFALVPFAGSAFLQCPLTLDENALRQSLKIMSPGLIPQGGSDIGNALRTGLTAFKEAENGIRAMVLITDGEDHEGNIDDVLEEARKKEVRIFTMGAGTADGELIRVQDEQGRFDFVRDENGNAVKSRLNEALLKNIAEKTKAFYLSLGSAHAMDTLYDRGLGVLPKSELATRKVERRHERFQWFLGAAILLLMLETFFPERRRVPRQSLKARPAAAPVTALLFLLLAPGIARSSPSSALEQFEKGRFADSFAEFSRLAGKHPKDGRLWFNAGAAAYRDRNYTSALSDFSQVLNTPDLELQEKANYNLGNTSYRLGEEASELPRKKGWWEQAIRQYEAALKINPKDSDAAFNRDLVKKKLEELEKQQQQQQQQQQQKQDQKNQQKDQDQQDKQKQDPQKQKPENKDSKQQNEQNKPGQKDSKENQKPSPESQDPQTQKDKNGKGQKPEPSTPEKKDSEGNPIPGQQTTQMTPQQAMRVLEGLKDGDKPLILLPRGRPRVAKDW